MCRESVPTLSDRVSSLERQVRSLERKVDVAMGAIAVVVVLGQIALAAWIGTVIR